MKVPKSIAVEEQTWKSFSSIVDKLKERNMVKSISDTIEVIMVLFVEEAKSWFEDHAYDGSEANVESIFMGGKKAK